MKGFTLIEVTIIAALTAMAAIFIVKSVGVALDESAGTNDRLIANQIVQERLSMMKNRVGFYVPVTSGSREGIYVGCYTRRGLAKAGSKEMLIFGKTPGTPSGACPKSEIEVQFVPSATDPSLLKLFTIVYRSNGALLSVHQREIKLDKAL